jgi:hypothetical protein
MPLETSGADCEKEVYIEPYMSWVHNEALSNLGIETKSRRRKK